MPASEEADGGVPDADGRLLSDVVPRATTPELPKLCNSSITISASPELNLVASPTKPSTDSTASKEQRTPDDSLTSHLRQQDAVGNGSHSGPRFSPHEHHAALGSTENSGHSRPSPFGSALIDQPLRRNSKVLSAPENRFMAVSRRAEGEAAVASKRPRLVSAALFPFTSDGFIL